MRDPGPLEAGVPARGLAARLPAAAARLLRRVGSRSYGTTGADAQFTAHVEQALQIVQEVPRPTVVVLPNDRVAQLKLPR
jgi:hypothetical protein